jgi:hypothetical protein
VSNKDKKQNKNPQAKAAGYLVKKVSERTVDSAVLIQLKLPEFEKIQTKNKY